MRSSTLAVIPLQAVSSNQYDNPLSRSGEEPPVGPGPLLSRSFARFILNQQRMKTTGPTKLTSLAQPMMFNGASGKVPRHEWSCGREAAVWTIFVAAVCRRIIVLGSRRGFDTMLPPPFGASIKF